ncbi:fluoride efflux transporter CrcB [Argonema galeatum]|uniref:fluoride efflux transporter CrcB n=1 Tax=Argonema galeatum TaxID=2942762 RepID=UPI00201288AB|nr:fluoride efflux transporter CrcB [Argonema galeatum A003/A1]
MLQDPNIRNPIAISLGAIAGALCRYYLTLWFAQRFGTGFPYGTFFINLSGCLFMGFFATLALERVVTISPEVRLLVATGFLGAYTTFSTYGLDTINLLRDAEGSSEEGSRSYLVAGLYWAGSAILGIISIQLGIILARWGK